MMTPLAVRVQEKGQVTIPLPYRRKLRLKKGDMVAFVQTRNGLVMQPAEVMVSSALDEIGRVLKKKGVTLTRLMERGRNIRGKLLEEMYGIVDTSE